MNLNTIYTYARYLMLLAATYISCVISSTSAQRTCTPLDPENILSFSKCISKDSNGDNHCSLIASLPNEFKGTMWLNEPLVSDNNLSVTVTTSDTVMSLTPIFDFQHKSCILIPEFLLRQDSDMHINVPEGMLEIRTDYIEVDDIDLPEEQLMNLSVAGSWHKEGSHVSHSGLFSIVDDDSMDGQIPSSLSDDFTYGYYSLLYPLLESLGLRGNLAVEGRRVGLNQTPPAPNDNLRTLVRLQDEKGWDLMSHSMECLGEILNNWIVDSLTSSFAKKIFNEGPNNGVSSRTVSVYDLQTRKQYWPNTDNTGWEETPARFIKPYVGNYRNGKVVMYNPDFDIEWHWAEFKRRAEDCGMHQTGFVTHNSTSSHVMVPGIMEVFPFGLSDINTININRTPMLSTGVRAGLEGQSMPGYYGISTDNTFNKKQFKKFRNLIDETAECGGWIIFNLHTYRDCWLNSLPGSLVSQGGTYPDEWVIPMEGMNSANDPLSPPARLGIKDWGEWHPCPGTRLDMMARILQYALDKGLKNVTCSEGFQLMGNKKSVGYFNLNHRIGMDGIGIIGTKEIYPHYVVSVTDEVFYYNPLLNGKISIGLNEVEPTDLPGTFHEGKFFHSGSTIAWASQSDPDITLHVIDLTGKLILSTHANHINLDGLKKGIYIVCAIEGGAVVASEKFII